MKIVERMFQIMTEKNIKDIELSRALGVSKSVVSSWRNRNTNPPAEYIEQICILLNVSLSFLLTGKESISPPAPLFSNSDEKSEFPMFYEQLKKICEYRGTTPTQVVTSLGYSSSKVTAWKNGSLPKPEILQKIASLLNVPVYFFFVDTIDDLLKNGITETQYNLSPQQNDFFRKEEDTNISNRIFDLLEKQNKTATELGKYLQISPASINGWKNGSFPSSKYIEKIASFFDTSVDFLLTGKERSEKIIHLYGKEETTRKEIQELIQIIEQLDEENMHILRKYLKFLTYEQNGYPTQICETSPEYPYFTCAESAHEHSSTYGRSSESGDDWQNIRIVGLSAAGEPIELPEDPYSFTDLVSVPLASKADFAVKIKGDSMEPDIPDASIVLVRKQPEVETGEIAIVSLDHAATCKKFYRYEDRIELVSINKNYKPIVIREEDHIDIRIIGKVLQ